MGSQVKRWLLGRPLKSKELGGQKLRKTKALAILSSDALSSVAYGPEQILLVLVTVGATAFWYSIPIGIGVLVLLTALILSYRQIIHAYPHGGGAYIVSKENLGIFSGLIAGGSLLVDYILTVAVSVSAGTDAITSAFPSLHEHKVVIAVVFVILITILNLRGVTESASILAYPVYLFVLALFILIGVGLYNIATGAVSPDLHASIGTPVAGISLFLLLRAFASGSSALTGVEAISNAIPNFKEPAPHNAAKTLMSMGVLLALLFSGIVFLAYYYGISPHAQVTVVSQIAETTFGRHFMYFFIQATTALILILAANTGYSAFPLLAVNLAKDKFIPRMFTVSRFVPRLFTCSVTDFVAPCPRATREITAVTPIMIPSIVSSDRSLLDKMLLMAILKACMTLIPLSPPLRAACRPECGRFFSPVARCRDRA